MTRALYPGSFDPVHIGHVSIVEAASRCFDEVVVVAMYNREKTDGYFTLAEREAMLAETFASLANVTTASAPGLVIQAAEALGADVIVKGVRSGTDLDSEMQMAQTNNHVSGIDTVLVPTRPEHAFVSSRYIREIHAQGEDVASMVPEPVALRLAAKRGIS
ncbi:MAG: pantetheine-phosphate adenylyltransferase [Acidimicrobiales bacterium]